VPSLIKEEEEPEECFEEAVGDIDDYSGDLKEFEGLV